MNSITFCKFHGFGNDYIVTGKNQIRNISQIDETAKKMCDRNTGIGGDGVALLEKLDGAEADYSCRIINPDGSEASFSGNGTRCAAAYLHYKNLWGEKRLRIQTKSGVKSYEFLKRNGNTFWYSAEIGKPKFASDEIPFLSDKILSEIVDYKLRVKDKNFSITAVNVGNPVCILFIDDFNFDWRKIGKEVESHELFPEKTNVVFAHIKGHENIEIRIWERGAGETDSSGTCSIAAAVASAFTGKTDRAVSVRARGGVTKAFWREDGRMLITGSADLVFCGEWLKY